MEKKQVIAITGGTGFIGLHLRKRLLQLGVEVRIISRKEGAQGLEGEKLFLGDISNEEALRPFLDGADILIHLAAELKDPEKFHSTNVSAIELLADLSIQNNVKTVIHLSSVGVSGYGHRSGKWINTEESTCYPTPGYEQTKLVSENIWNKWQMESVDNRLVIIRPTNVFGDHHPRKALLGLFKHLLSGKRFPLVKNSVVNYLYVGDLVESIFFFIQMPSLKGVFNVGYSMKMVDFIKSIEEITGKKANVIRVPYFLVRWSVNVPFIGPRLKGASSLVEFSDDKLKKAGFSYPFGVKEGLKRTYSYFREIREL